MNISLSLIFNLSLLVAISVFSAFISERNFRRRLAKPVLQGLLFGMAAVIAILYPVKLYPGVFFDGRSVVISLCSLFFGALSGGIAAIMALVVRLIIGGSGWIMGSLVITSSFLIGLWFHNRWRKDLGSLTYLRLYWLGLIVHVVMITLLVTLPREAAIHSFQTVSLPVLGFYPLATVVIGKILKDRLVSIQAQEEILRQKERAENSSRLKDAFIANISHEIRTPLNAILGFISIIEDEALDRLTEEEKVYFQRINQSGQRLTRTVDEILNYSRLLVSDVRLNPREIDLVRLVENLIVECRTASTNQQVPLVFDRPDQSCRVHSDEFSLRMCISNLIDNALKYTESGTITIRMRPEESGCITVSVSDTGIGMSDEFLQKLFEPYAQEHSGFTRRYEGVGLGLSIVKRLCDMLQVEIQVTSRKGEGSTFRLSIPSSVATDTVAI